VCHSVTEARAAAERLGYPVVLKGVQDGVAHKSDLGLVHVGLRDADADAVADAVAFLVSDAAAQTTGSCLDVSGGWALH
jgi:acyl-CoA synthetase (NDP forming)